MCDNYKDKNAHTETDAFPLPRIDEVGLAWLNAKYFASMDFIIEYHQV